MKPIATAVLLGWFTVATAPAATVQSVTTSGNTVRVSLGQDVVVIAPLDDNAASVEYQVNGLPHRPSEIIDSSVHYDMPFPATDLQADPVRLAGTHYYIVITRNPFAIDFTDKSGKSLFKSTAISPTTLSGTIVSGPYYGNSSSNVQLRSSWQAAGSDGLGGLANGPFVWSTAGIGVLMDADLYGMSWTLGPSFAMSRNTGCYNPNNLFFLMSGNPHAIFNSFRKATGSCPMPPQWALGFLHSKWGFNQQELVSLPKEYRSRNIPLDGCIVDRDWYNQGSNPGQFCWNTGSFPDGPSGRFKSSMDSSHVRVVYHRNWTSMVDSIVNNPPYQKLVWDNFISGTCGHSANEGIAAYWNDESDRGPGMAKLFVGKSTWYGHRSTYNERVWTLNRGYIVGSHRYAYTLWSGDIGVSFNTLSNERFCMLSAINVGCPWWTMDGGGFNGTPTAECYTRWMQMEAFCPVYRVHSTLGTNRRPWFFGADAERISRAFIQLRYRLIPYLYSSYWRLRNEGLPPVRSLAMDYPADTVVRNYAGSWMFGDGMLVTPVVTAGSTSVQVYLPQGDWVNFWTGATVAGGRTISMPVALDSIPVFVKAGSVIPMGPVMNYTGEMPADPLEVRVYPGAGGSFTLYEDDNITYGYEQGASSTIPMTVNPSGTAVTFGSRQGTFPGMLRNRRFNVVFVNQGHGVGIGATTVPDASILYTGTPATVSNESSAIVQERRLPGALNVQVLRSGSLGLLIGLDLPQENSSRDLALHLFDTRGRLVLALDRRNIEPGAHVLDLGRSLSNGRYMLQMRAGDYESNVGVVVTE